jgi:hypothetical protein
MSCCGRSRQTLKSNVKTGGSFRDMRSPRDEDRRTTPQGGPVEFEYLGDRTLIVMGRGTRQQYRFVGRGARLLADARDRVSLSMVPGLRETPR